jgi:hypothetical protein|tara:strand:- start:232 stop:1245 length:1014 start_codon:yes stop_codon:yes gene_type:complete
MDAPDRVVAVLEGRIHRQRGLEYRVRWQGSDGSDDEWFPGPAVEKDYPDLLLEFEDRTEWYPDANGQFPNAGTSTEDAEDSTGPNHHTTSSDQQPNQINQPLYSWKSGSKPPPKMSKEELKASLKQLSKYTATRTFTKDYANIAIDYRKQVKYIARRDDEVNVVGAHPSSPPKCSMCKVQRCQQVFFPCQHACVCNQCMVQHDIGVLDRSNPHARTWSACPVCVQEIKKIVPLHDGSELDYFNWLHEVKPSTGWLDTHQFANAGQTLEKGSVLLKEHAKPKIKIGDWLSENDFPMDDREKRRRSHIEERKRKQQERGRLELAKYGGGVDSHRCCVVS